MSAQPLDAIYWQAVDDGTGGTDYRLRETPLDLNYPSEDSVIDGVAFGHNEDPFTGNFFVPTEAQVEEGVFFGANGTEFEGTFQGGVTPDYPDVTDVRKDVEYDYGALVGTLEVGTGFIPVVGTWQERNAALVHRYHGVAATITRGATTTSVNVIPDEHNIDFIGGSGDSGEIVTIDRAFRIRCDAFRFGGILATPQAGDVVAWDGKNWEVIRRADYSVNGYKNEFILPCVRKF